LLYVSKLKGRLLGVRADLVESNSEPKLIGWSGAADTMKCRKERLGMMNQRCRVWRPGLSPRVEMIRWSIARSKKATHTHCSPLLLLTTLFLKSRIPSKLFKNI